jgi:hypothetical protein
LAGWCVRREAANMACLPWMVKQFFMCFLSDVVVDEIEIILKNISSELEWR